MIERFEQLKALHNAFFENDDSNLKTMLAGFAMSAVAIALVFVLY